MKRAMWIDCGIHAREWIAPAFCMWFVNYVSIKGLISFQHYFNLQTSSTTSLFLTHFTLQTSIFHLHMGCSTFVHILFLKCDTSV